MKKIICVVLAVSLLLGITVSASERQLMRDEIPLAESEAQGLYRLGILKGTENGLELERPITRAEAVALIYRICGINFPRAMYPQNAFLDVPSTHWAFFAIEDFFHADLIHGISKTEFAPDRKVTGTEFAKILLAVLGYPISDLQEAYSKGKEIGLLSNNFTKNVVNQNMILLRSDAVRLCHSALLTKETESGNMLYKRLVEAGQYQQSDFEGILFCATPPAKAITFADQLYNMAVPFR